MSRDVNKTQIGGKQPSAARPRGFATMSAAQRKEIARQGGLSHSREHLSQIGKIGGIVVSSREGHMAELGRLGGLKSRSYSKGKGK